MERYAAYKDSGIDWIGEIPEHWTKRRISSLFDVRNEKVSARDFAPLSVTMNGIVPQLETAAKTDDVDNRKLVRRNDFVINSRSDRRGACGFAPMDGSVSLISTILVSRHPGNESHRFLGYLLSSSRFSDEFYRMGTGIVADLWSTGWSRMKNIILPRPPHDEQRAIADFLDEATGRIDALTERTERSIELLSEYRKSAISEAVTKGLDPSVPMKSTDLESVGHIPNRWRIVKLGLVSSSILGRMLDEEKQDRTNPRKYLANRNVQWFRLELENLSEMDFPPESMDRYEIHEGDILVCEGGEIGRCCVWHGPTPDFYFQKAIHRLRVDRAVLDPDFVAYWFFSRSVTTQFVELRKGESTIAHLTGEQLERLPIPVPPLEEQRAIADHLDALTARIDAQLKSRRALVERLREYRRALISECVTGAIKVPGVK